MVLEPGDVVTTGTPPGVGSGKKPTPIFLKAGDVMELGVEKLGKQKQKVVAYSGWSSRHRSHRRHALRSAFARKRKLALAEDDEDAGGDDDRAAGDDAARRHLAEEEVAERQPQSIDTYSNEAMVAASASR